MESAARDNESTAHLPQQGLLSSTAATTPTAHADPRCRLALPRLGSDSTAQEAGGLRVQEASRSKHGAAGPNHTPPGFAHVQTVNGFCR